MLESLDEFGQLDEFNEMDNIIGGMMARATENKEETTSDAALRQKKIQKELDEVSKKYGRVMTPASSKTSQRSKTYNISQLS